MCARERERSGGHMGNTMEVCILHTGRRSLVLENECAKRVTYEKKLEVANSSCKTFFSWVCYDSSC
jgi:hypothetical protein